MYHTPVWEIDRKVQKKIALGRDDIHASQSTLPANRGKPGSSGGFIITSRNPATLFQPIDHAFHPVPSLKIYSITWTRILATALGRNDGRATLLFNHVNDSITYLSLVGDDLFCGVKIGRLRTCWRLSIHSRIRHRAELDSDEDGPSQSSTQRVQP